MVKTTQPGQAAYWKALHGPGRAKAACSFPWAARAKAISCPADVLPAGMITLGLSPSGTYLRMHTRFIWYFSSQPPEAGKYYQMETTEEGKA